MGYVLKLRYVQNCSSISLAAFAFCLEVSLPYFLKELLSTCFEHQAFIENGLFFCLLVQQIAVVQPLRHPRLTSTASTVKSGLQRVGLAAPQQRASAAAKAPLICSINMVA